MKRERFQDISILYQHTYSTKYKLPKSQILSKNFFLSLLLFCIYLTKKPQLLTWKLDSHLGEKITKPTTGN